MDKLQMRRGMGERRVRLRIPGNNLDDIPGASTSDTHTWRGDAASKVYPKEVHPNIYSEINEDFKVAINSLLPSDSRNSATLSPHGHGPSSNLSSKTDNEELDSRLNGDDSLEYNDMDMDSFIPHLQYPLMSPMFDEAQLLDLERRLAAYIDNLDDVTSLDGEEHFINLDLVRMRNNTAEPAYPHGEEVRCECCICFEITSLRRRLCCDFPACDNCMQMYLETQVNRGIVKIPCISGTCDAYVYRDEVFGRLPSTMKDRFYKFLIDANKDPKVKTCPRCSHIYRIDELGSTDHGKYGVLVTCPECQLDWCFDCHSPWHEQVKCKDYRKGDKLLKMWAKEHHYGHNNAQKCPRCKIYIERKGGCDHMVCSQCKTSFCYRCGERFLEVKFFGNHLSRLSPLGCKYNFKPDRPVARRLIRGSVFGATVLAGIGLLGFGVAAVGVLVGASVVIVPAMVGYKYHKYRKRKKHMKRQQDLFRMRSKNALMEMHRERAVLERASRLAQYGTEVDAVHVGIQTGQAQQVDVTVHNPYHPDTALVPSQPLNSEINVSVLDDRGKMVVTTAELTQNSVLSGDGTEPELVLHVKTSYSNARRCSKNDYMDAADGLKDKADSESVENEVFQDEGESVKPNTQSNVRARKNTASSSSDKSNSLTRSSSKASKHSAGAKTVDSDGFYRSDHKRCLHGSLSKNGSLSRKHKRSLISRNSETGLQLSQTVPDLGQGGEGNMKGNDTGGEGKEEEGQPGENLSQSGCFMKLFSKKLNNLQSQLEKEKEKQVLAKTLSDTRERELLDCPDIVSCAIEAELKNAESMREDGETTGPDRVEVDRFLGIVSKETYTTQL